MLRLPLLALFAAMLAPAGMLAATVHQTALTEPIRAMDDWEYVDCGLPTDAIQLKSISVSPDPPKPGQDLTVTVTGTVKDEIKEGAYADVLVKLGVIKLLQKTFDVCEEARNANVTLQCPVEEGEYTVVHTVELPKEVPRAKFVVQVRGYTVDDEDMACVDLIVDFRPKFPRTW